MLLALVVTYLLMAALFESFLYPFAVPFAALGGFVGLARVNGFIAYQALDVIAMLGFVILVGVVVNNAILIVHQTLNYMRDRGLGHREALRDAVSARVRPIFMSTLTSVMGMAPLVLVTGPGSEICRGLGRVVVGGLAVSTSCTLFLVPAVFSIVMDMRAAVLRAVRGSDEARALSTQPSIAHESESRRGQRGMTCACLRVQLRPPGRWLRHRLRQAVLHLTTTRHHQARHTPTANRDQAGAYGSDPFGNVIELQELKPTLECILGRCD